MIYPWHSQSDSKIIPFTRSLIKPKVGSFQRQDDTLLLEFLTRASVIHGCYKPRLSLITAFLASSLFVRTLSTEIYCTLISVLLTVSRNILGCFHALPFQQAGGRLKPIPRTRLSELLKYDVVLFSY